jgi:hypothetical protein
MLVFRDFVPRQLQAPRLGLSAKALQGEFESLESALAAANAWLAGAGVEVVNVETVVLPNLWNNWEEGSQDPVLGGSSGAMYWHQFIRVWYRG